MNPNHIDKALELHLLTLPDAPPITWEDVPFTPKTGLAYLQVNQLRNSPVDHAITFDMREDRGILQLTVVHPAGEGKTAALNMAHQIAVHFRAPLRLSIGEGQFLTVYKSPEIASGYPDNGWYRIPVSVSWKAGHA